MALRNERAKLDEASNDITEIIDAFARKNLPFSVQDIKDEFENKTVGSISRIYLMNLFDEVHQNKIKIGRAKITAESYISAKKSFEKYLKTHTTLNVEKFKITSINAIWIEDYRVKMGDAIAETTKNDYI